MTLFRTQHSKNYTVVNNHIITDNRLSWKAKGIWLYAFSRPDDWTFYMNDLIKQSTDGKEAVQSGLKELIDSGYLIRKMVHNKNGQIAYEWVFHETPQEIKEILPQGGFPPTVETPTVNPPLLSTEALPSTKQTNSNGAGLFEGLDLSDDDIRYLKKFDVGLVADAVLLVKKIEVKTTIAQALKWLVQKPRNQWPKPAASPADNETYAKAEIEKIKDLLPKDFRLDWLIGALEIVSGNWCLILEYKDPKMKEKLDEWILKVKSR